MPRENATVETYFADEGMDEGTCDVRIDGSDIVVSCDAWTYRGTELGPGHYRLKGEEEGEQGELLEGTATLHRFQGASLLVGNWTLDKYNGMWLIRLGSEADRGSHHAN